MHELASRLLKTIRKHEFMRAGDRVAVAVSGGADSVALLKLMIELRPELGIALSVAHVNHKLRGEESDADQQFVSNLAAHHQIELYARIAPVGPRQAAGIENTARRLRYEFFRELACQGHAAKIATAHTLDDQAETVLLRVFRGTGIRGLAGILPRLRLESEGRRAGEVVRPLLDFRRAELREYLRTQNQEWREDSSNEDVTFLRNRVRQRLLPRIVEEFGQAALEHMANLAEIARAEEEYWLTAPDGAHFPVQSSTFGSSNLSSSSLDVKPLIAAPLAAARRAVRNWLEQNAPEASISFRLIEEVLDLARREPGREVELPRTPGQEARSLTDAPSGAGSPMHISAGGRPAGTTAGVVRRGSKELILSLRDDDLRDYEYPLPVPGEIYVPELAVRLAADVVDAASVPEQDRLSLLESEQLGGELVIRNWRAGDRFWPAHTRQERKVKELLSDRHLTGAEKKLWPVAVCRGELVWMRGFPAPKTLQPKSANGVWIHEVG